MSDINSHDQKVLRILLVDDNDENRTVLKAFAKSTGWTFDEASDGEQALKLFINQKYDLVLLDMQMPVMDGLEALKKMRRFEQENSQEQTPIIAMSAYADPAEKEISLDAGSNEVLVKPIQKKPYLELLSQMTSPILCKLDPDLEHLIPEFLSKRKIEISELEKVLPLKQFDQIRTIGHKLRGAAGSYGFAYLSHVGQELEEGAQALDQKKIERALTYYRHYMNKLQVIFE